VVKSRNIRWAEHVECTEDNRGGFGRGQWKERDHMGYLGIDKRSIVKWVLKKWLFGI